MLLVVSQNGHARYTRNEMLTRIDFLCASKRKVKPVRKKRGRPALLKKYMSGLSKKTQQNKYFAMRAAAILGDVGLNQSKMTELGRIESKTLMYEIYKSACGLSIAEIHDIRIRASNSILAKNEAKPI